MRAITWLALPAAVLGFGSAALGQGPQITDVTGVTTTTSVIAGGAFAPQPGQVATLSNPVVQAAVGQASATVAAQLSAGTMTTPTGIAIPAAAQQTVASVMTTNVVNTPAAVALVAELGGNTAAVALVESVTGLLSNPAPGQLAAAIGHLNTLIDTASVEFLANPPPGFLVIHASLVTIVRAASAAEASAARPAGVTRASR